MKYRDWLNDWLDLYVKPTVKTRSYEKYKQIAYKHLIPYLDETDMDELTATALQKFTVELGGRLAPNTVNGIISVLKSSLKKGAVARLVQHGTHRRHLPPEGQREES